MKFGTIVAAFDSLAQTSKRIEKTHIVADLLTICDATDLEQVILLMHGRFLPTIDTRNLGIATQTFLKALSQVSGQSLTQLTDLWKKTGDLGDVAYLVLQKRKQTSLLQTVLTTQKLFTNLHKILQLEGPGSVEGKTSLMAELLSASQGRESVYLSRLILEILRVGIGEGIIRDALIEAFYPGIRHIHGSLQGKKRLGIESDNSLPLVPQNTFPKEKNPATLLDVANYEEARALYSSWQDSLDLFLHLTNDSVLLAMHLKEGKDITRVQPMYGKPLQVMLAQKVADIAEAFTAVGSPAQIEYKYDGFRVQIHKDGAIVKLFTRRLEDVTLAFPDVVEAVLSNVQADRCIIDSELIGFNPTTFKYVPFQEISMRIRRKYDIDVLQKSHPVEVNAFDFVMLNMESLLQKPLQERRVLLEEYITQKEFVMVCSKKIVTNSQEIASQFYEQAKAQGYEGLMFKSLGAPYKPGSRVGHMVKLKPTMDTLDVVIVGATWGEGKRSSMLTSFDMAVLTDEGTFVTIGKVGTGFKELEDENELSFPNMTKLLVPSIISESGRDISVKPEVVLEVAFEEIQKSETTKSTYALRFPRAIRLVNTRSADNASTVSLVEEFFYGQVKRK